MNKSSKRSLRLIPSRQRGLTLIEMAISMTIALFLLSGVITIVMSTRTTFGTQDQLAQLQDGERLAMSVLTDSIEAAGYYPNPRVFTPATALLADPPSFAAGQGLFGTSNAVAPGDTLTARYATLSGDGIINCTGLANNTGDITNALSFENKFSVNAANQLQCEMNGTAVILVNNVQNMQILYGVATAATPTQTCTDSYMTAAEVAAAGKWANVCSVRVTLSFTNPVPNLPPIQFTRVIAVMATAGANS